MTKNVPANCVIGGVPAKKIKDIPNDIDEDLDEARILEAKAKLHEGKTYDHTEVWKELDI